PMSHQLLLSTSGTHTESTIPSSLVANNLTGTNTQETSGSLITNTYIAPIGNTTTSSLSSASALSPNTWGFALASTTPGIVTNNFNTASEYTSTDQSIQNTNKYASVPTSGNEVLLTQDTTGTSSTTIYYGVLADRDIPAGSYGNTVLYTALAEQPNEIRVVANNTMDPAVIDITSPHQTTTIYTSINTTASDLGTATISFTNSSDSTETGTCDNPTVATDSNNYVYITCTSPDVKKGNYNVSVTLSAFGRILTGSNVVTYDGTATMANLTYMQDMTRGICQNTPIGNTRVLKDSRGMGSSGNDTTSGYNVLKANDGNCWMTDNLNLYNKIIYARDSDFDDADYTIPASSTWTTRTMEAKVHVGAVSPYVGKVYYTWAAANALIDGSTTKDQNNSICPKNWKLPYDYSELLGSYNISNYQELISTTVLNFSEENGRWQYDWNSVTPGGNFWTSHPYPNNIGARCLYYRQDDGGLHVNGNFSKGFGNSVRCVAR
ncbi:hypothetical protein IKG16_01140, partial [Candidatus Saccharibacteria bacterium]|nr:hypothetical protein [Candidatus Saccharibacteria bacterium]